MCIRDRQLTAWNESRVSGDIEGSLDSVAHMLKNMIVKKGDVMSQSVVHLSLIHI